MKTRLYGLEIISVTTLFLFSGCGMLGKNVADNSGSASSSNGTAMKTSALSQQAIAILQSSCISCHGSSGQGGISNITDPNTLLSSGLVIPGNPMSSPLILSVTKGGMPVGGALTSAQINTLESWIQTEFVQSGSSTSTTGATPSPSSSTSPSPAPSLGGTSNAALNAQVSSIFQNDCVSCHGANSGGSGGFNYITDVSQMVSNGLIVPGNPSGSILYQQVNGGAMQGYLTNPSQDLATISTWISTMSASPSPLPSPSSVPLAATYTSINANIVQPKCVGCHSGESTYSGLLHWVSAGNPNDSDLYTETKSGDMPRGGTALSTAELSAISTWITDGAPNN